MARTLYLAGRLREVFLNGKWIANTNYKEQLETVDYKHATHKNGNLNTIAALTFHINYYLEGLLKVLNGGPLDISDHYSFNIPEMNTEADWNMLVATLLQHAEDFAAAVGKLEDAVLDTPFVQEQYGTYLRNIEAVIEHSYYHLGQIVLIRKMIQQSS
jgi:uncharacterized damage-inducible protein DinB